MLSRSVCDRSVHMLDARSIHVHTPVYYSMHVLFSQIGHQALPDCVDLQHAELANPCVHTLCMSHIVCHVYCPWALRTTPDRPNWCRPHGQWTWDLMWSMCSTCSATILDCVCLGLRVKDYFLIRAKFPGLWCVLTVHAHLLVVRMSNSTKFLLYFIFLHLGPTKFKRPLLDCKFSEFGNLQIFRK